MRSVLDFTCCLAPASLGTEVRTEAAVPLKAGAGHKPKRNVTSLVTTPQLIPLLTYGQD